MTVSYNPSIFYGDLLSKLDDYSYSRIDAELNKLELRVLARNVKNKFPDDIRSLKELCELIDTEYDLRYSP